MPATPTDRPKHAHERWSHPMLFASATLAYEADGGRHRVTFSSAQDEDVGPTRFTFADVAEARRVWRALRSSLADRGYRRVD